MKNSNDPVIVSAVRTAVGKAFKGALRETRPDDLAAACFQGALEAAGGFDPAASTAPHDRQAGARMLR